MHYKTIFKGQGLLSLSSILLFLSAVSHSAFSHPGNFDQNGGHYHGNSYHCHLGNCEIPDTFSSQRRKRNGFVNDRRYMGKFFNNDDWNYEVDLDQDCQSTRQEMLILTSRTPVKFTNPRNCVVRSGNWLGVYTGDKFEIASRIDIDHIIPRLYAHSYGGDRWSAQKKMQFSNDPMNLVLTSRKEIRKKNQKGPSRYLPQEKFICEYVALWDSISERYDLQIDRNDKRTISKRLQTCRSKADRP
jgi:hypothetical protein